MRILFNCGSKNKLILFVAFLFITEIPGYRVVYLSKKTFETKRKNDTSKKYFLISNLVKIKCINPLTAKFAKVLAKFAKIKKNLHRVAQR